MAVLCSPGARACRPELDGAPTGVETNALERLSKMVLTLATILLTFVQLTAPFADEGEDEWTLARVPLPLGPIPWHACGGIDSARRAAIPVSSP